VGFNIVKNHYKTV